MRLSNEIGVIVVSEQFLLSMVVNLSFEDRGGYDMLTEGNQFVIKNIVKIYFKGILIYRHESNNIHVQYILK